MVQVRVYYASKSVYMMQASQWIMQTSQCEWCKQVSVNYASKSVYMMQVYISDASILTQVSLWS